MKTLITCTLIILAAFPGIAFPHDSGSTRPYSNSYYRLNNAIKRLSGSEWPDPGLTGTLKINDSNDEVLNLKKYLKATGDLEHKGRAYFRLPVFDNNLEEAVKLFQVRHGLEPDGIAGRKTIDAMKISLDERLSQLMVNLERLKSLPADMGERYIIVNIPGFEMKYFDNSGLKIGMNVVVGEIENYTPVMSDTMTYIVFNPAWNVPVSITVREILPQAISDPGFIERNNYAVLKGDYNSTDTIPPEEIDWQDIDTTNLPFRLVQKPGRYNSLGRIKFMFPNNYNIYLHDTPSGQLFSYEKRAFSHGCIRLEKPVELAEMLLESQMQPEEISNLIDSEETVTVPLRNKVVVYITYLTAWVDGEDHLNFRDDIYNLDQQDISRLKKD